jgi:ArsR family transcriptional regulator, arsenate/arsenite/antimonite-responsive transcriptional repressor
MRATDETFKAISDPTRREILRLLSRSEMSAGGIADHFSIGRPTLSHHLAVLKEAGLVAVRREGQTLWYSLDATVLQEVMAWALSLTGKLAARRPKSRRSTT